MITQQTLTTAKQQKVYYHLMKQFRQKNTQKMCSLLAATRDALRCVSNAAFPVKYDSNYKGE